MCSCATRIAPPIPVFRPHRIPTPLRSPGRYGDSLSSNGSCAQTPASHPGTLRSFVPRYCPAAAAYKVEHGGLSSPPTPSVPRVRAANFACRYRSSPFTPPQDRPASLQHLENWSSPQRPYPELLAEISRASFSSPSLSPGLDSLVLPKVWWWLWVLLVTVGLLTLSVTFPINGTKKLQSAAKQEREAKERRREGVSARLQLRNLSSKTERVLSWATIGEAARLLGSCHYHSRPREGTQSPGLKTRHCLQSETQ